MARFELPNDKAELQEIVRRFGEMATSIASNQAHVARLNHFISEYVNPDELTVTIDGKEEHFGYAMPSGVTLSSGSLVHARLHQPPGSSYNESMQYVGVIGSLYSSELAEYWLANSSLRERWDSPLPRQVINMTELITPKPFLRVVEEDEDEDISILALQEVLAVSSTPQIEYGQGSRMFRVDAESYETLHDIKIVQDKVNAIRSEYTSYVVESEQANAYELPRTGSDE